MRYTFLCNFVLPPQRRLILSIIIRYALQNCLGALDGAYIKVNVPESDWARYRTSKGEVATNVLGVCGTKGDFVYVLVGCEGLAADSRIILDAILRPNGLKG